MRRDVKIALFAVMIMIIILVILWGRFLLETEKEKKERKKVVDKMIQDYRLEKDIEKSIENSQKEYDIQDISPTTKKIAATFSSTQQKTKVEIHYNQPQKLKENFIAQKHKKKGIYYIVKKGDTLGRIARKFFGDPKKWKKIAEANKDILPNPNILKIGQRIFIPDVEAKQSSFREEGKKELKDKEETIYKKKEDDIEDLEKKILQISYKDIEDEDYIYYVVKKGDTLGKIALKFLGDSKRWMEIYKWNEDILENPNSLKVGIKIKIKKKNVSNEESDEEKEEPVGLFKDQLEY